MLFWFQLRRHHHDTMLDIVNLGTHRLHQWLIECFAAQGQRTEDLTDSPAVPQSIVDMYHSTTLPKVQAQERQTHTQRGVPA